MQLKNKKSITAALASAVSVLISGAPAQAEPGWQLDTAYLYYKEKDRITASEPALNLQKTFSNDSKLNLNLVWDSLTGASPSGAAPSNTTQTITRASGKGSYTVPAKEIPLDDGFSDSRSQYGLSWDAPLQRLMRYNVGINSSSEDDFESKGFNTGISRDFNKRNTTLAVGYAYEKDEVSPLGGIPAPVTPQPE